MDVRELTLRASTPLVVNVFNQFTYLRRMVERFRAARFRSIVIIDNGSTYPPLLRYLERLSSDDHAVVLYYGANHGPHYFFQRALHRMLFDESAFLYTDPDIELPVLAPNFLCRLFDLSRKYQQYKVGCALRLPDASEIKDGWVFRHAQQTNDSILDWERQYWLHPVESDVYNAPIDTTLHLFNPMHFPEGGELIAGLRVAGSGFEARHLPWFKDDPCPADEFDFYQLRSKFSTWVAASEQIDA